MSNHGGIVRLARWVGKGRAMKVAMGYPMTAEEAFRIGVARWLVPHAELTAQTTAIAERLAELPLARLAARQAIAEPRPRHAQCRRCGLHRDLYLFMALPMTEDAKESHQAWRERRRPQIRGA